jgi:murein L,D-transpeptidase YafK
MKKFLILLLSVIISVLLIYYFFPEERLPIGAKVDKIVVFKSERKMKFYSNGNLLKTYKISLGGNSLGDKEFEGDKRTPEGEYVINGKNHKSGYYKNLGISYPNKMDIREARNRNREPGGDIKIHGLRNGVGFISKFQRWFDWTAGCIALTNSEVDEIYDAVEIGTPITILP